MRSGDLFLEVSFSNQATALIKLQKLAHLDLTVAPHSNLNFSRGAYHDYRDGQVLNTKHLILTFSTPDLPQTVKMAYIRCPVRRYIPNPLRCFQCQRYGHSKNVCRGQPTCPRCGESGHDSADCKKKEQCLNCKGEHPAYSRSCPTWITKKEITAVKIKEKISYPEARRVVLARTPVSGKSYASATRKSTSDKCIQCDSKKDISSDSSTPTKPEVIAPSKNNSPPRTKRLPPKNRDDTLTGDCSEDDEDLMDIQSGLRLLAPEEERVRHNNDLLHFLELPWFED
ncbi:uncharacterized protein TNCV_264221 [Trichonephila clavipes]|nr:uncharacterized protein TNCV_264221 [Trichonephila clavipes]